MPVVLAHYPSRNAGAIFAAAVEQARLRQTSLVVVNVTSDDALADPRHASAESVAEHLATAEQAGVAATFDPVRSSDPASAVLAAAERVGAELLVLGVRNRSSVGKLLLGSTAQRLILGARCDVLAVKVPR